MKKFLFSLTLLLLMLCSGSMAAPVGVSVGTSVSASSAVWYRTVRFAFAKVENGNYTWGDWEESAMKVSIDNVNGIIHVYSNEEQEYHVYKSENNGQFVSDDKGGKTATFYAVDQDGDKCNIRQRVESDGGVQLYIDFNDCAWVYQLVDEKSSVQATTAQTTDNQSGANVMWFHTKQFASAEVKDGEKYTWGDWEESNMRLCIDLDKSIMTVYSPTTQVYTIYDTDNDGEVEDDNGGGKQVSYLAVDQDGDKCRIRLRIDPEGSSQVYIDFNNVAWVYEVERLGEE